ALAGGALPYILAPSQEKGVVKRRKRVLESEKIDIKDFEATLHSQLTFDPLRLAPYIDGSTTLHILAYFDKCVPYCCGLKLYNALPGAEKITLATGHYSAMLTLPYISHQSLKFINKKLNIK
ncbi:MAG: alpha/beta hydrolase, partial [Lentisphaeraceae bacterium]|nr:alpha/beta hydrolase [Lentisphaeraceae bacterium]